MCPLDHVTCLFAYCLVFMLIVSLTRDRLREPDRKSLISLTPIILLADNDGSMFKFEKFFTSLMQSFLNICSARFEILLSNLSLGTSINILNI